MSKTFAALAAAFVVVACGGGGDGSTTPKQAAVSSVTMSQQTATMIVGTALTLTAIPKDGSGNTLTGRTTTWTSSNSNVATVVDGSVAAMAPGTATITATIEGKTATTEITVQLAPVATVTVTPAAKTIIVGGVSQLTATLKDANGNVLAGRTVVWTSSDETKVTVSSTGVVTGVALGTVTITATSEGKSGTATITVSDGSFPIITGVAPDTIVPGVTVTITGTGFSANAQDNAVTVGGIAVAVTAASATQLSFVLPASFPCRATQRVSVVVTTDLGSGTTEQPLKVAIQRSLAVGQSLMLTDVTAALACNELSQTGGRYLMSVYNTSTAPSTTASFELQGNMATGATASIVAAASHVLLRRASIGAPLSAAAAAQIRRRRDRDAVMMREHALLMESDRALVRRVGPPRRWAGQSGRGSSAPSLSVSGSPTGASSASFATAPLTVGSMTNLRFRTELNNCRDFNNVRARVVYVGTKAIVLEDSIAPLAKTMDADLTDIGQEFDNVMYPILTQNFGNILAYDSQTDNNGHIMMLFTPRVDSVSAGGLQGFVSACDMYKPTDGASVAGSNQAEIFYARVPKNASELTNFRRDMKGTVIHESKHITANAVKFASPEADVLEESWLEEGTAQIASELYARTRPQYDGVTWKSDATYLQSVYCDVRPTFPGRCNGAQFLMADHLSELHDYYRANETKSYLSRASADITVYGSGWKFARWATDQYATSESDFLKSIVAEPHLTGVANIVDKTHHPFLELSGWFTLALLADDYPNFSPPADAKYTFPSWNIPDIFQGFATDFPSFFVASPLNTHFITFGSFDVTVGTLAGGSGSLFSLDGTQSGAQAVALRASGGGLLDQSTPLRIVFLRVQ